ncbi:dna-directed rna polymerase subunit delta [Lucifera butyrica]|uniref:RNAP delta factor n=1 Tax=Lucifera butyrica TaxID=1351585 RepID=A0A498R5I0_9FIRM|nr:DNA-directed RNA polymerase subunit delta [Lucifera butyrica]VBB06365.1 dna-directed rna polymerase subunit delta [Lucifera butyrica]
MADRTRLQSEVDLAYKILQQTGHSLYFRELISQVLNSKQEKVYSMAHAIAEVHTQINMDSRFMHMGKGMWGLTEWMPQRGVRYMEETAATTSDSHRRREKLLAEIQQDYAATAMEAEEHE